MSDEPLISFAQNGEDVVLWRALGAVANGVYVDVGACDPVQLSVTKALYDHGWRGIDIDAVPAYVDKLREARPGNEAVHAAITDADQASITMHVFAGSGLSTLVDSTAARHQIAGFEREDVEVPTSTLDAVLEGSTLVGTDLHLLKIDVEGAEAAVLRSFDLARWRPWVVVVEATLPLSTEPSYEEWDPLLTGAGWVCTLFDGISRYYVSPDHPELVPALSYPACALDDFITYPALLQTQQVEALTASLAVEKEEAARQRGAMLRWRNEAVAHWADAVAFAQARDDLARQADADGDAARRQTAQLRDRLAKVRAERRELRDEVRRLTNRVARLRARLDDSAPEGAREAGPTGLRAVAKRVVGR